jgi:hypothetical protein
VLVGLLDPEAGDGPADDELLDLLGAFEDVEDLGRYQISAGQNAE